MTDSDEFKNVSGVQKNVILSVFHEAYNYKNSEVAVNKGILCNYFKKPTEKDTLQTGIIPDFLDRVLSLCLNTDICQKTGLSFNELMHTNIFILDKIEEKLHQVTKATDEILSNLEKPLKP